MREKKDYTTSSTSRKLKKTFHMYAYLKYSTVKYSKHDNAKHKFTGLLIPLKLLNSFLTGHKIYHV